MLVLYLPAHWLERPQEVGIFWESHAADLLPEATKPLGSMKDGGRLWSSEPREGLGAGHVSHGLRAPCPACGASLA